MSKHLAISAIQGLQAALEELPESTDLKEYTDHFFAPGIYLRTLFIPAGFLLVGRRHRHEVLNILMKGTVIMVNEQGEKVTAKAPLIFTAKPGQKAGFAVTDIWYATVHANPDNNTDIEQLEKEMLYPVHSILEVVS
jgi:hypothetical protein